MSDLTPITREEALLDGADLEPITRKEQFIKHIYDATQEIPEPITREEWFLKKAGEGTSPVTVEPLSVTENGIYSETGKAYSPVIVEVPEPTLITKSITANGTYSASADNADGYSSVTVAVDGFKKKSIANTPTDIASFADGTANPMPSLEISIEPVQSGSGDPSPSNVRPISGWSGAQITVADDLTTPTETHTLSIPFRDNSDNPITVYGGRLNVTSGELTKTHIGIDLSDLEWGYNTSGESPFFYITLSQAYNYVSGIQRNLLCDRYISADIGLTGDSEGIFITRTNILRVRDSSLTSANDIAGQLVYELATPQTYQLTPAQVSTLLEQNNIFADCGKILEGEYFVTL